jgi:formylglycine-generating enzyme required for sulfatase activity
VVCGNCARRGGSWSGIPSATQSGRNAVRALCEKDGAQGLVVGGSAHGSTIARRPRARQADPPGATIPRQGFSTVKLPVTTGPPGS